MTFTCSIHGHWIGKSNYCPECTNPLDNISYAKQGNTGSKNNVMGYVKHVNTTLKPFTSSTKHEHPLDIHKLKFKFNILKNNPNFSKGDLVKGMRGWAWRKLEDGNKKIHVKKYCIEILIMERILTDNNHAEEVEEKIIKNTQEYALKFAKENNFEIDPNPIPTSKEVKCLDFKLNENFRTKNSKSVYTLPSPLEFTHPRTAVKDAVGFISKIDIITNSIINSTASTENLAHNMDTHVEIMKEIKVGLKDLNSILGSIKKIAEPKPSVFHNFIKKLKELIS